MLAYLIHFGCRLNLYESASISSGLKENNISITDKIEEADFIIINTCTVTNRADQKNRSAIRRAHRKNPNGKIIVTGCYATTDAEVIRRLSGVYSVVSNQNKANLPRLIQNDIQENFQNDWQDGWLDGQFGYHLQSKEKISRAYLKIQDGCNKSCSYCKIPLARGPGRSRNFDETILEAQQLIQLGFKEITLTGVNLGWYRSEKGKDFHDLLSGLLDLDGDFYIRISSIEPGDVSEELAHLLQHPKMAKFLHVPLQSGSKEILKKMRRGYTPLSYHNRIQKVKENNPNIHIGTDIIVGFPGESDENFEETIQLCEEIAFANIHIFPYSKRKGTPIMKNISLKDADEVKANKTNKANKVREIPSPVIRKRIERLKTLKEKLHSIYIQKTSGQVFRSIIEKIEQFENTENAARENTHETFHVVTENYVKLTMKKPALEKSSETGSEGKHNRGDMIYVSYNPEKEGKEIISLNSSFLSEHSDTNLVSKNL